MHRTRAMTSSSTRQRIFAIITAVATLVAGLLYATAPTTDDGEPPPTEVGPREAPIAQAPTLESYRGGEEDAHGHGVDDIGALRREVDLLREDLDAVHRRLEQLARRAGETERQDVAHNSTVSDGMPTLDPSDDLAAAHEAERQRIEAESEQSTRAQAEANEAALQSETADTAWSGEAHDLITSAFATQDLTAASVADVECRATLCRVEVTHKNPQARAVFERQFTLAVAHLLPRAMVQAVENEDGSTSAVFYLARDGHDFPQPKL